jgi:hypothetical protein
VDPREALMKKKTNLTVVRLGLAVVICAAAGAASAQPLVKGTFTLPYEVHWGKAVLAPGHYSITIDRADRPALVTTPTGKGLTYVMARSFDDAMKGQPTALIITKSETQRIVRSLNWREGNRRFIYRAFTEAERKELGGATELQTVTIRTAQK